MNKRQTILIVDDSPTNIRALSEILKNKYTIKVALGGKKAIEIALLEEKPDLILLDVMMPHMDGYTVCKNLKMNPQTANIPIIFVTAKNEEEDEETGFELGAVDYITKPFKAVSVLARVDSHLRLQELNQSLSERVESEVALRLSAQTRYGYLFESSPIPIFVYRVEDGVATNIEEANEATQKATGYSKEELLGINPISLYAKESTEVMLSYEKWINKNETSQFEMECVRKDGTIFSVMAFATPLDVGDKRMVYSYWTDLTLIKQIEAEKLHKERLLIQQSKLAAMGEMIGAIAHQWRQPLNSLGLLVQDVEFAFDEEELDKEYVVHFKDKAMDAIKYMSKTIDDFKNFFSPHKKIETFFIEEAIRQTLSILEAQFKNNNIAVTFGSNAQKIPYVCNKNELSQVFLNILANAKDALLDKKNTEKFIVINTFADRELATITIEDSAGGIPTDIIDKIFESHFTTKEQSGGTGIGLYMSKSIVEEHLGGSITVENTDNGAKFTIRLPLTQDI